MWSISKALQIPLDSKVAQLSDLPHTLSFVIRKRVQVDNFNELPREQRPTTDMIWHGTTEELEDWIDRVVYKKKPQMAELVIEDSEIEG